MTTLNELRSQADEIASAGHAGWGNTMRDAADEIDRLRTEAVAADIRIANDALVIAGLTAELEKHCGCEFDGDENTKQCTLHNAWAETLHEQAGYRRERDALARCKLADQDAYVAMRDQRDAARADAKRLEWLSQQGVSFGFQDIHEGNKWEIGGPYATLRIAIDAEMKGEQP